MRFKEFIQSTLNKETENNSDEIVNEAIGNFLLVTQDAAIDFNDIVGEEVPDVTKCPVIFQTHTVKIIDVTELEAGEKSKLKKILNKHLSQNEQVGEMAKFYNDEADAKKTMADVVAWKSVEEDVTEVKEIVSTPVSEKPKSLLQSLMQSKREFK